MIANFINRKIQNDTCVYWGAPTPNKEGGLMYAAPVEIKCFWLDEKKTVFTKEKREIVSETTVFVNQDLAQSGLLYHGTLESLYDSNSVLPDLDDLKDDFSIFPIAVFTKYPSLTNTSQFIRAAYLSQGNR